MSEQTGLERRYEVRKINDAGGKHDGCRYFVLDPQHDPAALEALKVYAAVTPNRHLRRDLLDWLDDLASSVLDVVLGAALLASGVVVPAAEPKGAAPCDNREACPNCTTAYVECADGNCIACDDAYAGQGPAAEPGGLTLIVTAEEYDRLAEMLDRPPRVLPRLAALLNESAEPSGLHPCEGCGAPARDGLAERVRAPEMVEAVAASIEAQQVAGRIKYVGRVGYQGRLSLARAALDAVYEGLGVPTSIDAMLAEDAATEGGEG